jgi:DNA-binding IclR family transcriptional regulator
LARAGVPRTLSAIAADAGMSPSKAHFYLTSFARIGLVTQAGTGGPYQLGPAAVRIGVAALEQVDVLQLAREALFELRDETRETAYLSVWGNRGPTIVHRVQGLQWSPLEVRVGLVLPALSATGRAFLAWFPRPATRDVLAAAVNDATPHDPWFGMSPEQAMLLLDDVRRDGVARGQQVVAAGSGFTGLAAPVFDHEHNVSAVFTIIGDARNFDMSADGPNVRALLAASKKISQQLAPPPQDAHRAVS